MKSINFVETTTNEIAAVLTNKDLMAKAFTLAFDAIGFDKKVLPDEAEAARDELQELDYSDSTRLDCGFSNIDFFHKGNSKPYLETKRYETDWNDHKSAISSASAVDKDRARFMINGMFGYMPNVSSVLIKDAINGVIADELNKNNTFGVKFYATSQLD